VNERFDYIPNKRDRITDEDAAKSSQKGLSRRGFLKGAGAFLINATPGASLGMEAGLRFPDLVVWFAERQSRMRFERWEGFSPKQRENLIEKEVQIFGAFMRSPEGQRILNEGTDEELFTLIKSSPPFLRDHIRDTKFDISKEKWPSVAVGRHFIDGIPQTRTLKHDPKEIFSFYNGNGFFIKPNMFLTNWHVVEGSMKERSQGVPHEVALRLMETRYASSKDVDVIAIQFPESTRGIERSPILAFDRKATEHDIQDELVFTAGIDPDSTADPDGTKIYPSMIIPLTQHVKSFIARCNNLEESSLSDLGNFTYLMAPGESMKWQTSPQTGSRLLDTALGLEVDFTYPRAGGTSGSPILRQNGEVVGINRASVTIEYQGMCIELGFGVSARSISEAISGGMLYEVPTPQGKSDRLHVAGKSREPSQTIEGIIRNGGGYADH